jgi:hypothetical protein
MAASSFDGDSLSVIMAMCGVLGFTVCTRDLLIVVIRGVQEVQSDGRIHDGTARFLRSRCLLCLLPAYTLPVGLGCCLLHNEKNPLTMDTSG